MPRSPQIPALRPHKPDCAGVAGARANDCPAESSFPRKALIREPERPSALQGELPESDGTKTGSTTSSSTATRLSAGVPHSAGKALPKSRLCSGTRSLSAPPRLSQHGHCHWQAGDLKRGEGRSPRSTAVLLVRGVSSPYLRPWTSPAQCSACSSSSREQAQHLAMSFFTGTGARADIRQADA